MSVTWTFHYWYVCKRCKSIEEYSLLFLTIFVGLFCQFLGYCVCLFWKNYPAKLIALMNKFLKVFQVTSLKKTPFQFFQGYFKRHLSLKNPTHFQNILFIVWVLQRKCSLLLPTLINQFSCYCQGLAPRTSFQQLLLNHFNYLQRPSVL